MKILLVEDSASMRSYLSNIIENGTDDDVEIVEAANGFEALKTLPHHKFDAILTDQADPITRRRFLTLMGASLALAGLAGCSSSRPSEKIMPYLRSPEEIVPGKYVSFCEITALDEPRLIAWKAWVPHVKRTEWEFRLTPTSRGTCCATFANTPPGTPSPTTQSGTGWPWPSTTVCPPASWTGRSPPSSPSTSPR